MLARDFQEAAQTNPAGEYTELEKVGKRLECLDLVGKKFAYKGTIQGIDPYQADFEHPDVWEHGDTL